MITFAPAMRARLIKALAKRFKKNKSKKVCQGLKNELSLHPARE